MPDTVVTRYPGLNDKSRRELMSLGRQYDVFPAAIVAGNSLSEEIPVFGAAGIAISIDNTTTATHIAVYASAEEGGMKRAVYDEDNALLIVTVVDGIVTLPPEVFPLGYIALALCSDADGTLTSDQADLQFLVLLKG